MGKFTSQVAEHIAHVENNALPIRTETGFFVGVRIVVVELDAAKIQIQ